MDIKKQIHKTLQEIVSEMGVTDVVVEVTYPELSRGDYTTNIAMVLASKLRQSPLEIATAISANNKWQIANSTWLEKIEAVKPGFINFTLKDSLLIEQFRSLPKNLKSEPSVSLSGKKIMIEFTDPNPFKEFHIGHLYSNIVGESLSRLFESQNAEVKRVNYQGDVGLHVAKSVWGMQQKFKDQSSKIKNIEEKPLEVKAKFLGEAYALGSRKFEEDQTAKEEIIALNKKIYEKDPEVLDLYNKGRQWSIEYFEIIYRRLGTEFWHYYFESEAGPIGVALVKEYLTKGIFEESEGAIIFRGEPYGFHTRVFINSLGLPTYEAKELGLAPTKYEDYPYDTSIIVTGNEINEYFKVLLKALSLIYPDLAKKTKHISHGMVRLPEGKMSSRTGNVKTGEWLLDEAHKRAWEKIQETTKTKFEGSYAYYSGEAKVKPSEQWNIAEMVGTGAVKFALLKSSIGRDIEFNFEESVSFEGNSGPYLLYTYVRTRSLLGKSQIAESELRIPQNHTGLQKEERNLILHILRFSEVVKEAAEKYSPSLLCTYLFVLAQEFNLFYQKHPILKEEENVRNFRLALAVSVGDTINRGLDLLGIKAPEKM